MRSVFDRNVVMRRIPVLQSFLRSVLDVDKWIASRLDCFTSGKKLSVTPTQRTEGWVGPNAGLEVLKKRKVSCLCQEPNHDTSVFQHVA